MSKIFILFLASVTSWLAVQPQSIDELGTRYESTISSFRAYNQNDLKSDHALALQCNYELVRLFNKPLFKLIKQMRQDIAYLKKEIRKNRSQVTIDLLQSLSLLYKYIKRQRINYNAIYFHKVLQDKYCALLRILEEDKDVIAFIDQNRELFNLEKYDQKFLKTFLHKLANERHEVSKFEDYLHADYIELKLVNYIFKIDLVKIRNAIIFDKRYRSGYGR